VHEGRLVTVEPLDPDRHAAEIYPLLHGDAEKERVWDHLPYGPFPTFEAYRDWVADVASKDDPLFFAIRNKRTERVEGVASLMEIRPAAGVIEIGHINLSTALQNTMEATEGLYLLMTYAMDQLRYRRFEWKCNALNENSRRAAARLGFSFEGIFYQHSVPKGHNRDTAWFSTLDYEWPAIRRNFERWLSPDNFDADGRQRMSLGEMNRSLQ
jgi:RimJ/RimL family protein N-acetyltransferase